MHENSYIFFKMALSELKMFIIPALALECVGMSRGLRDASLQRHVNNSKHTQAQRNSWHASGLFPLLL